MSDTKGRRRPLEVPVRDRALRATCPLGHVARTPSAKAETSSGLARDCRHYGRVLFELDDVVAARGGNVVLDGLRVAVAPGATCVAGPSGAGKSTLLRLLNRLADPDRGVVRYRGRDTREVDPLALRREVGLVPQLPALLEGTVADNILYGPRLAGRSADVSRCLTLAGLDGSFAQRQAASLSVGEQQRVMLARALALEPDVLLLDEPTSALDEASKQAVEATLLALRSELDLSFVFVTHDLNQAKRLADRVLWLQDGHLGERPLPVSRP
jgi:putative ABC transport system ATP-binding protein